MEEGWPEACSFQRYLDVDSGLGHALWQATGPIVWSCMPLFVLATIGMRKVTEQKCRSARTKLKW